MLPYSLQYDVSGEGPLSTTDAEHLRRAVLRNLSLIEGVSSVLTRKNATTYQLALRFHAPSPQAAEMVADRALETTSKVYAVSHHSLRTSGSPINLLTGKKEGTQNG